MTARKTYTIAVRGSRQNSVPADWLKTVRETGGVEVKGATRDQVQVLATQDVIRDLRRRLGDAFIVEENFTRQF